MTQLPQVATDPRNIAAASLATIGLVNWLLQTYVFHGATPAPVATFTYLILPAAVGYLMTHIALNQMPPVALAKARLQLQDAIRSNKIMVLPDSVTIDTTSDSHTSAPPQDAA